MATEHNKPRPQKRQSQQNEGEGSRTAARNYNEDLQRFVKKGQVQHAAEKARRALDGSEAQDLKRAEELGRSHARELDAERDYDRQSKKTE